VKKVLVSTNELPSTSALKKDSHLTPFERKGASFQFLKTKEASGKDVSSFIHCLKAKKIRKHLSILVKEFVILVVPQQTQMGSSSSAKLLSGIHKPKELRIALIFVDNALDHDTTSLPKAETRPRIQYKMINMTIAAISRNPNPAVNKALFIYILIAKDRGKQDGKPRWLLRIKGEKREKPGEIKLKN